jgi:hypothetical protein
VGLRVTVGLLFLLDPMFLLMAEGLKEPQLSIALCELGKVPSILPQLLRLLPLPSDRTRFPRPLVHVDATAKRTRSEGTMHYIVQQRIPTRRRRAQAAHFQ